MKETVDEIRFRLLHDENVRHSIQHRAYEIWILRGRQHGRSDEDWALAENEIISFLIEQALKKPDTLPEAADDVIEVTEIAVVATPLDITPEPIAEADVIIIDEPVATVADGAAEIAEGKKPRKRAATSAPRKAAAKEGSARKPAAKKTTATTAKKPAAKKATGKKASKPELPTAE